MYAKAYVLTDVLHEKPEDESHVPVKINLRT